MAFTLKDIHAAVEVLKASSHALPIECEECGQWITAPGGVTRHNGVDYPNGPFTCTVCKKKVCGGCTNYPTGGPCVECAGA